MSRWDEQQMPDELREVADRLRDERAQASPVELDEIKLRTMARAGSARRKGAPLRSRLVVALLSLGLVTAGTTGVVAAGGGNGNGNGNSSSSQYKPGLGCGDTNHIHTGPPGNPDKTPANSCPKGSAQNP
jgi:hypothetical protein